MMMLRLSRPKRQATEALAQLVGRVLVVYPAPAPVNLLEFGLTLQLPREAAKTILAVKSSCFFLLSTLLVLLLLLRGCKKLL